MSSLRLQYSAWRTDGQVAILAANDASRKAYNIRAPYFDGKGPAGPPIGRIPSAAELLRRSNCFTQLINTLIANVDPGARTSKRTLPGTPNCRREMRFPRTGYHPRRADAALQHVPRSLALCGDSFEASVNVFFS